MIRWSYDNDKGNSRPTVNSPPLTTGRSSARPIDKIADVPNGMIGVPNRPPTAPMLEMVNDWPVISSSVIVRS